MLIGIDASRAFLKKRTGIEEYSYQVIKSLVDKVDKNHQVFLYIRKNQEIDFTLPKNWRVKTINFWRFWTQIGLSLEMLFHPVDVLFIPAHTVPWIHPARNASLFSLALLIQSFLKKIGISTYYNQHNVAGGPKNTIVTIHGLEYEFCPKAYSFWERIYMRSSIKNSCRWAKKIIAVSENTKKDLMKLYKVPEDKIWVIYEGYDLEKSQIQNYKYEINSKFKIQNSKFLLFIGRLEERKNIIGIIEAFEILKEKHKIPHKLILAGKGGFGYQKIKNKLSNSSYAADIFETGFISDEEKFSLLKNADVFLFPTFYEGFGLPILEAQSVETSIVASMVASIPEVAGDGAILVNPKNPFEIAEAVKKILTDENFKKDLIAKGLENVKRFSWDKCAEEIVKMLEKE